MSRDKERFVESSFFEPSKGPLGVRGVVSRCRDESSITKVHD